MLLIITSTSEELLGNVNINDLEPPQIGVFSTTLSRISFALDGLFGCICVVQQKRSGTCHAGFHCTTAMQGKQANNSLDLAKSTSCHISSENTAINKTITALFNFNFNNLNQKMTS